MTATPEGPVQVLVVDDEPGMRMTVAMNLELDGYAPLEADSGEAALELLARSPGTIAAVLSDIRMPGMSGVQMLKVIRQRWSDLPVILMTAFTSEAAIAEAVMAGAFTVLSKPFHMGQGARVLARALQRSSVLVVDDGPSEAESLASALEASGVHVTWARSGQEALEKLEGGNIDVVLTDLHMPGMDGPELIGRIRARDPEVLILAYSGQENASLYRRAASAGALSCLRKPLQLTRLLHVISQARAHPTGR